MKKSILTLGKVLDRQEQQLINGGNLEECPVYCGTNFDCYDPDYHGATVAQCMSGRCFYFE